MENTQLRHVIFFQDGNTLTAEQLGGKGWNLCRLARYGFRVPIGGVLFADVYSKFMANSEIVSQISDISDLSVDDILKPSSAERLKELQHSILQQEFSTEILHELRSFLQDHSLSDKSIAVRSSAVAEDGVSTSFAGIHQSFLDVGGFENMIEAIKKCYASLWTQTALAYRRKANLTDEDVRCAVVLCEMVTAADKQQSTCAGVAFSCEPRTGRRDLTVINAAPGIGEAVVSGAVNPDEFWIQSATSSEFSIIKRPKKPTTKLTDEQLSELYQLITRASWIFGDGQVPQDIEWAFDGENFWVLQVRPVTNVPHHTYPEAKHQPVFWSNANVKDAVPGVLTPLTWSCSLPIVRGVINQGLEASGYPVPQGMEIIRRFSGRAYFDLTGMQVSNYEAFGLTPNEINTTLGGHQPEVDLPTSMWDKTKRFPTWICRTVGLLRRLWKLEPELQTGIDEIFAQLRNTRKRDASLLSKTEILQELDHPGGSARNFRDLFGLSAMNFGVWSSILEKQLAGCVKNPKLLTMQLMANTSQVTSAEHGYRLQELAKLAAQEAEVLLWIKNTERDPNQWKTFSEDSAFRQAFDTFLDEYGHRGVYEIEFENPRWIEDPSFLFDQIYETLQTQSQEDARTRAQQVHQAGMEAFEKIAWYKKPMLRWLVDRCRRGSSMREMGKSALIASMEWPRRLVLETGKHLVSEQKLDSPEDVFYLHFIDLEMYLAGIWDGSGATQQVKDLKLQREEWLQESPPNVISLDAPEQVKQEKSKQFTTQSGAKQYTKQYTGIAVASGCASGIARVIRHPNEGHLLQPGDILVAPSTDPGWTPLFLRASAVVMETGGFLSHGAIVSREYGIPAVVNIPGILSEIKSGDQLEVDGNEGCVRHLQANS